jgi:hypothetical protein
VHTFLLALACACFGSFIATCIAWTRDDLSTQWGRDVHHMRVWYVIIPLGTLTILVGLIAYVIR